MTSENLIGYFDYYGWFKTKYLFIEGDSLEKVEKEYKIFDALKLFIGQLKKAQDDANKILKFEIN